MKKTMIALLLCLAMLLTACGSTGGNTTQTADKDAGDTAQTVAQNAHQHVQTDMEADGQKHWYVCQCGEEISAPHKLDDNSFCQGCNSEVFQYEEGGSGVYTYDEYGTMISVSEYDEGGVLIYQQTASCEYYEDGNMHFMQEYVNGVLNNESTYMPCSDPAEGVYLETTVYYYEDGSTETVTYDEGFNILSVEGTDASGEVFYTERYEYEFDDQGNCVKQTGYIDEILSQVYTYTYDAEGNETGSSQVYYDEDGQITEELHFDAYGDEIGSAAACHPSHSEPLFVHLSSSAARQAQTLADSSPRTAAP